MTVAEGVQRITQMPGAAILIEQCRWDEDQRGANLHFFLLLGELTGRLEPDGIAGFTQRGDESNWLRLADVDVSALKEVVRRMERLYTSWHLDGGRAMSIHDKINCHFATAQVRRQREG
jgi:hypothetical protein